MEFKCHVGRSASPGRHKRRIQPEPTRQVWRRDLTPRPADGLEDRVAWREVAGQPCAPPEPFREPTPQFLRNCSGPLRGEWRAMNPPPGLLGSVPTAHSGGCLFVESGLRHDVNGTSAAGSVNARHAPQADSDGLLKNPRQLRLE